MIKNEIKYQNHTTKWFSENLLAIEMIKTSVSSVKWGLLTRSRSGFFKFLTTLKTIKNH